MCNFNAVSVYDAYLDSVTSDSTTPWYLELYKGILRVAFCDAMGARTFEYFHPYDVQSARDWFNSDDIFPPCPIRGISFRFICEALDLDADRIRAFVKERVNGGN